MWRAYWNNEIANLLFVASWGKFFWNLVSDQIHSTKTYGMLIWECNCHECTSYLDLFHWRGRGGAKSGTALYKRGQIPCNLGSSASTPPCWQPCHLLHLFVLVQLNCCLCFVIFSPLIIVNLSPMMPLWGEESHCSNSFLLMTILILLVYYQHITKVINICLLQIIRLAEGFMYMHFRSLRHGFWHQSLLIHGLIIILCMLNERFGDII